MDLQTVINNIAEKPPKVLAKRLFEGMPKGNAANGRSFLKVVINEYVQVLYMQSTGVLGAARRIPKGNHYNTEEHIDRLDYYIDRTRHDLHRGELFASVALQFMMLVADITDVKKEWVEFMESISKDLTKFAGRYREIILNTNQLDLAATRLLIATRPSRVDDLLFRVRHLEASMDLAIWWEM